MVIGERYTDKADVYRYANRPKFLCPKFEFTNSKNSFGIILWELMENGGMLYDGLHTNAIANAVAKGVRPTTKKDWDTEFVDLMKECWHQGT